MNASNNASAGSRRGPYRLWLAGVAAGTLLAVAIAPPTGWIARSQIATLLGSSRTPAGNALVDLGFQGQRSAPTSEINAPILRGRPADFPLHLAAAMEAGQEARAHVVPPAIHSLSDSIRALESKFPKEPGLYAAALRLDTQGAVRVQRPEWSLLTGDPVIQPARSPHSEPDRLAKFDRDAAAGEALEPDNAYFPMMRCIGLFAAHRDKEAIDELARAAACGRWDEHLRDEVDGKWRLAQIRSGHASAVQTIAIAAAVLFPHYAQIRAASQIATLKAMELEQAGQPAKGARLRQNVMRIGDLMRSDASSIIGNLVGIAVVNIGVSRPGGAPAVKIPQEHGMFERERDAAQEKRFAMLADYWQRNGLGSDVPVAKARYETGTRIRALVRQMAASSLFNESSIVKLAALWMGGAAVLANAWWLLVAGGIGAVAHSRRRGSYREPMPRSGPVVLTLAALLFAGFCANSIYRQCMLAGGLTRFVAALSGLEEGGWHGDVSVLSIVAAALGFAGPVLLALGAVIVSVVKRVPIRAGLAQAFSRVGIPLACLLALGFCGICVATARWEARVNGSIRQTVNHEGKYLSRITGQEWPGPIE